MIEDRVLCDRGENKKERALEMDICVGTTYQATPANDPAGARRRTTEDRCPRRLAPVQRAHGRTTGPPNISENNTAGSLRDK